MVCGNFVAPRTFTVNGIAEACAVSSSTITLPAPRMGGFCMQAGAGDDSYAYYATY